MPTTGSALTQPKSSCLQPTPQIFTRPRYAPPKILSAIASHRAFLQIMVYHSPYSTPDGTPLAPDIIEASTPWSDVLLEDLRTTIQFNPPTRLIRKYGYGSHKTRFRGWGKALWLSLFVIVGSWWVFWRGQNGRYRGEKKIAVDLPTLDGLHFIDANHPYIRVCYWPSLVSLN